MDFSLNPSTTPRSSDTTFHSNVLGLCRLRRMASSPYRRNRSAGKIYLGHPLRVRHSGVHMEAAGKVPITSKAETLPQGGCPMSMLPSRGRPACAQPHPWETSGVVDRSTTGSNSGGFGGRSMDGRPAQWIPQDTLDELNHLAKVRVAGSNPA